MNYAIYFMIVKTSTLPDNDRFYCQCSFFLILNMESFLSSHAEKELKKLYKNKEINT